MARPSASRGRMCQPASAPRRVASASRTAIPGVRDRWPRSYSKNPFAASNMYPVSNNPMTIASNANASGSSLAREMRPKTSISPSTVEP